MHSRKFLNRGGHSLGERKLLQRCFQRTARKASKQGRPSSGAPTKTATALLGSPSTTVLLSQSGYGPHTKVFMHPWSLEIGKLSVASGNDDQPWKWPGGRDMKIHLQENMCSLTWGKNNIPNWSYLKPQAVSQSTNLTHCYLVCYQRAHTPKRLNNI